MHQIFVSPYPVAGVLKRISDSLPGAGENGAKPPIRQERLPRRARPRLAECAQ